MKIENNEPKTTKVSKVKTRPRMLWDLGFMELSNFFLRAMLAFALAQGIIVGIVFIILASVGISLL